MPDAQIPDRELADAQDEALVVFAPSGKRGTFRAGTTVLEAARNLGVDLDSICGGRGMCGRCQVEVSEGSFAKLGIDSGIGHLNPVTARETEYARRKGLAEGRRLGCSALIQGPLVIDVPATSQLRRQVVRKRAEVRNFRINPAVRLHYVEVAEPDMHYPSGDLERLLDALADQWGIDDLEVDLHTLQALQKALRDGDWRVTVAVHRRGKGAGRIIHIWPGLHETTLGLAFDIGSTTIACHLANLATGEVLASVGGMNPQIRYGEDLMSRVSYVMMNPGGEEVLTRALRAGINGLIDEAVAEAGIERGDILNVTFVGNPVMHHLLLGIDPTELGGAPFALATNTSQLYWASELGLNIDQDARVYVLPCIAGHVGADTAGVLLSETPWLREETVLIADIGTNAEIVLGNRERLLAASSPTGPAFEGAQIICGQRAAPGAIERVRIDRETLRARFKVIGCDLWSDEPEFGEATRDTGVTGICGSGIIEVLAEMYLAGILTHDGRIDGRHAGERADGSSPVEPQDRTFRYVVHPADDNSPGVAVYQTDVRAIQLAKAALYAGARLLMDRMGIDRVDRVVLAGAFGAHIDPLHALVLGLVPDCPVDKVSSAGNAAGTGALIALLDVEARTEIEQVVRKIQKVETAVEPEFQRHFVDAMGIPHATAAFANLAAAVELPVRPDGSAGETKNTRRGGRRRNR